jgi:hypothetical protein
MMREYHTAVVGYLEVTSDCKFALHYTRTLDTRLVIRIDYAGQSVLNACGDTLHGMITTFTAEYVRLQFPTSAFVGETSTIPIPIPIDTSDDSVAATNEVANSDMVQQVTISPATFTTTGTNRDDILIGYELETDSWPDSELHEEAYDEAIMEWVDSHFPPDTAHLSSRTVNTIREELCDAAREELDSSDYTTGMSYSDISNHIHGFTAHRDGSVSGPEIVLSKPQTIDQAKRMTVPLFSFVGEHEAEINTGCSFHIHVSVKGRAHTYGYVIQSLMIDYVLQQAIAGRLPTGLLDRWCNGPLSSYFAFDLDSDKYNFVAHRPYDGYTTWEFRCFGNIDNANDAQTCIDVAVESYCWAYAMIKAHGKNEVLTRVFGTTDRTAIITHFTKLLDGEIEEKLTELRNISRNVRRGA